MSAEHGGGIEVDQPFEKVTSDVLEVLFLIAPIILTIANMKAEEGHGGGHH